MSIRRNILVSYLAQVINVIVGFAISIIVARLLGAAGRGEYAIFTNSLALAGVWLGFSLPTSVVYFTASQKIRPNRIFFSLSVFILLTSLLVFLFVKTIFLLGKEDFIFPDKHQDNFWILLFCVLYFSTSFNTFLSSFLNARQKFIHVSIIAIGVSVITLFLLSAFYFNLFPTPVDNLSLVIYSTLAIGVLQMGVSFFFYTKFIPDAWKVEWLRMSEIRQMFTFSFIGWIGNAIQFLSYRLDLWFIDYYHGKVETGVYSLSVTLAQMLWILPNVIGNILFSYLSDPALSGKEQLTFRFVKLSFWVSMISSIGFTALSFFFIPFLYGSEFDRSPLYMTILMLGILPFSITPIIASYNATINKIQLNLYAAIVGFVFALLLYSLLIPKWGIIGACIATIVSYNVNNYLLMRWFHRTTRIRVWDLRFSRGEINQIISFAKQRF